MMLAGFTPWNDDTVTQFNDGSMTINHAFKCIVATPLTFPEYILSHPRDLLKQILVPDAQKRVDMEEILRHTWLGWYGYIIARS